MQQDGVESLQNDRESFEQQWCHKYTVCKYKYSTSKIYKYKYEYKYLYSQVRYIQIQASG